MRYDVANMAKQIWFKRKTYGWGWTPATWQGWAVIGIYTGAVISSFLKSDENSHSASDTLFSFIPMTILLTLILLAITYLTGEKPSWQWGNKEKKD